MITKCWQLLCNIYRRRRHIHCTTQDVVHQLQTLHALVKELSIFSMRVYQPRTCKWKLRNKQKCFVSEQFSSAILNNPFKYAKIRVRRNLRWWRLGLKLFQLCLFSWNLAHFGRLQAGLFRGRFKRCIKWSSVSWWDVKLRTFCRLGKCK
jgi:hypothetical protein